VAVTGGWGGITLAHKVGSRREVDAVIEGVGCAGGVVGRKASEAFWGGYNAVVLDPDGHPWEIAHNSYWVVTDAGGIRLGES